MTFFSGRGFAELQILKKWKWPYLLSWVEYCDEILHTHWYWHDVTHEIVKWHLGFVEVMPRFKFWKQWNLTLKSSRTLIKFCRHIDIDKIKELQNDIYHPSRLCPAPNSEKVKMAISLKLSGIFLINCLVNIDIDKMKPKDCQISFGIVRGVAEVQILKKWK